MENIRTVFTLLLVTLSMGCASMLTGNNAFNDWRPLCEKQVPGLMINGYSYLALQNGSFFVNTIVDPDDLYSDITKAEKFHEKLSKDTEVFKVDKKVSYYLSGPVTTSYTFVKDKGSSLSICFSENQYQYYYSFNDTSCRILTEKEFAATKACLKESDKIVQQIKISNDQAKNL